MSATLGKIIAARTTLVLEQPFFGALALRLKLQVDPTCKTGWVNGRTLGFNPAYINSLSHDQIVAFVAHEVEHVALGHPWRRGGREPERWNIACDKSINTQLREAGFATGDNWFYAEGDEVGKSAEWIHGHLPDPNPQPPQPEPGDGEDEPQPGDGESDDSDGDGDGESDGDGDSDSDGDGQPGDSDGDDSGDAEGEGDSDGGTGDGTGDGDGNDSPGDGSQPGEVRDAPVGPDADGDEAPTEEDWKEATATAAALAKGQGKLPAGMARAIADALKPRVDVRSLVLRWMQERTASDYNWMRPNIRFVQQGLYLPALHSNRMGYVAIMVDTSGSIDHVALSKARGIVQSVLDECDPSGMAMYFADAQVANIVRMERGDLLDWQPAGGGGTDFRPALEAIEQDEMQPVCCICITDLMGVFPTVPPEVPVLWLSTLERDWNGQPLEAPFGETVYVGD